MPDLRYQPRSRIKPESTYLETVRRNVTSQAGEDGIIERVFSMAGAENRWCVEFGAWDGRHFSNTWSLIANKDWSGVLIEGDARKFQDLRATHGARDKTHLIGHFVGLTPPDDLDTLLSETPAPPDFDLLSIDIDGIDWHVWQSLVQYQPRVVVIEFNQTIPNDVYFVQDPEPEIHQGSSLRALIALGKDKGYELVATTEINAIFVRRDLFSIFQIADNDIDAMHDPGQFESKIFQLYDGTLMLAGCRRLLWAETDIGHEALQVLPPDQRNFTDQLSGRERPREE